MRLTRVLLEKRRRNVFFNNYWHAHRDRPVKNLGIKEAIVERGIPVYTPEEVFSSYLPPIAPLEHDYTKEEPLKEAFPDEESHPLYHERPVMSFLYSHNPVKGHNLNIAKNLTKTVQIATGLPSQVTKAVQPEKELLPRQNDLIQELLRETFLCDSTQKLLPRRIMIPYIGWHPVKSRMSADVPYEVTHSYQRSTRREYGIPIHRRNKNLMRGMFRYCDFLSADHPALFGRNHLEDCVVRQFFERDGQLVRIYFGVPFVVTGPKPARAFATPEEVAATAAHNVPNISPLGPFLNMEEKHVYRHENNFPILSKELHSAPNVHIGVELYNSLEPTWDADSYLSRALILSFLLGLGQARLTYGPDVTGVLPEPVTSQFITTDGKNFYFSAFQLNTLDLDSTDGVKNIFWHQEEKSTLFEVCDYVKAVPTLEGYNPQVFSTILAMYLQNAD